MTIKGLDDERKVFNNFTIGQILTNPTGSGTAYTASREMIKEALRSKYYKLIQQYKQIKVAVFKIKDTNRIIFYLEMPSEKYENLFYDVFVEVQEDPEISRSRLTNFPVRFYSNSPSFTFTYTYVLNKEKKIIPEFLIAHCNRKALTEKPEVRNPMESMGFEKSIYFSLLHLYEINYLDYSYINNSLVEISKSEFKTILSNIRTDLSKLKQYNDIKTKKKKPNKTPTKLIDKVKTVLTTKKNKQQLLPVKMKKPKDTKKLLPVKNKKK